jgi:hypothetical protein
MSVTDLQKLSRSSTTLEKPLTERYVKPERIWLKGNPVLTERWVEDRIAADPAILNLGDLVLRERQRPQPRAGRLDLLLQDPITLKRYEVELQIGSTDEATSCAL